MSMEAVFTTFFVVMLQPVFDELIFRGGGSSLNPKASMVRDWLMSTLNLTQEKLVLFLPLLLFLTFFGQAVFNFFSMYLMKTLGLKIVRNVRDQMYRHLVHHSIEFLSHAKTGDLISRISNDIEKIRTAVSETVSNYVRETLKLASLLALVFYLSWRMALVSLVLIPLAGFPLYLAGRRVRKKGVQSQEAIGELSNFLAETVIGNKIVKAYNMEEFEIGRFRHLNHRHYRINAKISLVYSLAAPVMTILGGLVAGLLIAYGSSQVREGALSAGQFITFLAAMFMMYEPLKRLSTAHIEFQQGTSGYDRVRQIMLEKNAIQDRLTAVEVKEMKGEIEFRHVSFAYVPDVPVLDDLSFTIKAHERVALVGASGAGKTTILNLILRFYDPVDGNIFIDGREITAYQLKSLRDHIGLVTQEVFLFNDTILNNIVYGRRRFSRDDVQQAARIARAADFIESFPDGYDTIVGERGMLLSAGQRQRISVARAIVKNPSILIFDEATSSLDSESETLIQEAMEDVMQNRTSIVIAHRLSTIVASDRIIVLHQGRIVEFGSHKELLKKKGYYHTMYNFQFPEMGIEIDTEKETSGRKKQPKD